LEVLRKVPVSADPGEHVMAVFDEVERLSRAVVRCGLPTAATASHLDATGIAVTQRCLDLWQAEVAAELEAQTWKIPTRCAGPCSRLSTKPGSPRSRNSRLASQIPQRPTRSLPPIAGRQEVASWRLPSPRQAQRNAAAQRAAAHPGGMAGPGGTKGGLLPGPPVGLPHPLWTSVRRRPLPKRPNSISRWYRERAAAPPRSKNARANPGMKRPAANSRAPPCCSARPSPGPFAGATTRSRRFCICPP
jgi:hypothetical protein